MTTNPAVSPVQGEAVETCRVVDVDGQPVRVRGGATMDDTDRAMLAEVVRAAKAKYMAEGGAERLAESLERLRQHLCGYVGQPTCDCKYGASGRGEQTGCPELRDAIDYLRTARPVAVPAAREGETGGRAIYLAARYSRNDEMRGVRDVLSAIGYRITSRWIDQHNGELEKSFTPEALSVDPEGCAPFGIADVEDLRAADIVVSFTSRDGGGKGGRHVEFGMALGLGKRLIVVGPRENIFHTLPEVEHYPNWSRLVMALTRESRSAGVSS